MSNGTLHNRQLRHRALVGLMIILLLTPVGFWWSLPHLLAWSAPWVARQFGLDGMTLHVGRATLHELPLHAVAMVRNGVTVYGRDGRVRYRLSGLAQGRLVGVEFDHVLVEAGDVPEHGDPAARLPGPDALQAALTLLTPEALLARMRSEQVVVQAFELSVPSRDFVGAGELRVIPERLLITLRGRSPDWARNLSGVVSSVSGHGATIAISEDSRTFDGLPTGQGSSLAVEAQVEAERLLVETDVNLHGAALDLVAGLLGLPRGAGSLQGQARTSWPWPITDTPDWRALDLDGRVDLQWQPDGAAWRIGPLAGTWRLTAGALEGEWAGAFWDGVEALPIQVATGAGGLQWVAGRPRGPVSLQLGAAEAPWFEGRFEFGAEGVALGAETVIGPSEWARIGRWTDQLPGAGGGRARVRVSVPWPEHGWPGMEAVTLVIEARALQWHLPDAGPGVELDAAHVNLTAGRIEAELNGRVQLGGFAVPLLVRAVLPALRAAPWQLAGTVQAGGLPPLDWQLQYDRGDASARGTLAGALLLERPLLGELLPGWAEPWDLDSGRLRVDAEFGWQGSGAVGPAPHPAGPGLHGLVVVDVRDGEARYGRLRLHGLAGTLPVRLAAGDWHLEPTELNARQLDAGLILEQLQTHLVARPGTVTVGPLEARAVGGTVTIAPFDYDRIGASAALEVALEDVDLAELLGLYGEHIAGSGRLDGHLPAFVADGAVSIRSGRLRARPPGGHIRLSPALARVGARPGLDFALRALEDFTYTLLDADVDYAPSGDLTLAVRLHGRNPGIEGGRPIHYNLTVTENVPQLLESLAIEGRLLERLKRRFQD